MADATYDAVIIGGGTKTLFTAMYLAKYGGMKVGVFERRHELGGGLACAEGPGGGFVADTHASTIYEWYYRPVQEDFPDFEEKGCKFAYHPMTLSAITKEDQMSVGIYQHRFDPTGEKTAQLLSQFSQKDADTYLKLFQMCKPGGEFETAFLETFFSPPPPPDQPDAMERWALSYVKRPDALIDYTWMQLSANRAVRELWETLAFQLMTIRRLKAVGTITEVSSAMSLLSMVVGGCAMCYIQGGTHNVTHACQRVFLENGGEFFTKSHVDKILIENGRAKGIRLADGTEVEADLVVSGVDPRQLAFQLIGPDHISQRVLKRVDSLEDTLTCITWYTWALHELPRYEAASRVNPGLHQAQWVMLATKDMNRMISEAYERRLGKMPDAEGMLVVVGHHSRHDETRAPAGKHTCLTEQHVLPAWALTEREWMAFKKKHAQDIMREWQQYAPNMTWDNVIGCDALTPYDTAARLINLAPTGNQAVVDALPGQGGKVRPIPEFSRHRTPIQGLYATGSAWGLFHSGSAGQGYACYKAIAEDLHLGKPWDEKGRSY